MKRRSAFTDCREVVSWRKRTAGFFKVYVQETVFLEVLGTMGRHLPMDTSRKFMLPMKQQVPYFVHSDTGTKGRKNGHNFVYTVYSHDHALACSELDGSMIELPDQVTSELYMAILLLRWFKNLKMSPLVDICLAF